MSFVHVFLWIEYITGGKVLCVCSSTNLRTASSFVHLRYRTLLSNTYACLECTQVQLAQCSFVVKINLIKGVDFHEGGPPSGSTVYG